MLEKLGVTDLKVHVDDRGSLYEVVHDYDLSKFGQQYIVTTRSKGTVRAYHRHKELWDWFTIVAGAAKFVIADPDAISSDGLVDVRKCYTFVLDGMRPQVLTVPPGYWHGWQALEDNTVLNSVASHTYNHKQPDEERIDPYSFGKSLWDIRFK